MIWSPYAANPDKGFDIMPDGSMHMIAPDGYMVMTLEECDKHLAKRGFIF